MVAVSMLGITTQRQSADTKGLGGFGFVVGCVNFWNRTWRNPLINRPDGKE